MLSLLPALVIWVAVGDMIVLVSLKFFTGAMLLSAISSPNLLLYPPIETPPLEWPVIGLKFFVGGLVNMIELASGA